jgi:hypothetical protein
MLHTERSAQATYATEVTRRGESQAWRDVSDFVRLPPTRKIAILIPAYKIYAVVTYQAKEE